MADSDEWVSSREGAELLGIPQPNYLYYAKIGEIAFRQGKKAREYSRADTLKLRRELASKSKRTPPEPPLIDWVLASDIPVALKLSMAVYSEEVDLAEAAVYQSWRKNNSQITIGAFNQDRSECYATIQLVPLDEQVILDVLAGRREESSIKPDEIQAYDRPGPYTLLCTSATALKSRPFLLYELLYRYTQFWVEQYPERYITKIYAQTVSESGILLAQHMFMSPRPDLAYNAFELNLSWPPASKLIRQFKQQMEEKAPLPSALHWPPIKTHLEAPQPLYRFTVDREIAEQATLPTMSAQQRPTRQKAATTLDALQPPGTITLQELADQMGMPRRSLLEKVVNRNLDHIAIPHPSRAGEMKRYFTPEQADAVHLALNK